MGDEQLVMDLRPAPVPRKRPIVGDLIYIPGREGRDMLFGGWAKVSEVRPRGLLVQEDPGHVYIWGTLQFDQHRLWEKHGASRARQATLNEVETWIKGQEARIQEAKAKAEEIERRRWLPMRLPVVNRGILTVPVWDDDRRTKKWAAILELNPTMPGGFDRKWFQFGCGPVRYIVPNFLRPGDVVEFAADRARVAGKCRWYGYVLEIRDDSLVLQPCKDSLDAVLGARNAFPSPTEAVA